ncbi:hypothetical protein F4604DRAFT_1940929 [Suillus subluteus]|nr:hypothetical protein F4604DRAFT_1940929 [Suillus subluteus]
MPIILTPQTLENVKAAASTAMITAIFDKSLFLTAKELTDIVMAAVDKTIAQYSGKTHTGLLQWKLRSEGSQHISRMKGELKQIYVDFQNVADMSMLSAYGLAHDILKTKQEMTNSHIADIRYLLSNYYFADVFESVNGVLLLVPFGHMASCNLLEYIISVKQYSRYLLLDQDGWETRLKHAIAFAAMAGHWSLEKSLAGRMSLAKMITSKKHQKTLLGGIEHLVRLTHPKLIPSVPKILMALYQNDIKNYLRTNFFQLPSTRHESCQLRLDFALDTPLTLPEFHPPEKIFST